MRSSAPRWLLVVCVMALEVAVFVVLINWSAKRYVAAQHMAAVPDQIVPNSVAFPGTSAKGYNPANHYWVVLYDCRSSDVEVSGIVPESLYWSAVPYDLLTLPLDSYLYDETIVMDDERRYTMVLTTEPGDRVNAIDVSTAPEGVLLIRTSYPKDREQVEVRPSVGRNTNGAPTHTHQLRHLDRAPGPNRSKPGLATTPPRRSTPASGEIPWEQPKPANAMHHAGTTAVRATAHLLRRDLSTRSDPPQAVRPVWHTATRAAMEARSR